MQGDNGSMMNKIDIDLPSWKLNSSKEDRHFLKAGICETSIAPASAAVIMEAGSFSGLMFWEQQKNKIELKCDTDFPEASCTMFHGQVAIAAVFFALNMKHRTSQEENSDQRILPLRCNVFHSDPDLWDRDSPNFGEFPGSALMLNKDL